MCVFTSYYADVLHSFCALVVGLNQPLSHPYTLTSICPPLGPQNGLSHLEEGPDGKEHRERVGEKRARKGGYSWGN